MDGKYLTNMTTGHYYYSSITVLSSDLALDGVQSNKTSFDVESNKLKTSDETGHNILRKTRWPSSAALNNCHVAGMWS